MSAEPSRDLDRVADLPTPPEHLHLVGHDTAFRNVIDAHATNRLHHAWLLTGPKGIGKETLAYRLAAALLAGCQDHVTENDPTARQIAARSHPNLLTIDRPWDEKSKRHSSIIPVSEVRRTQAFFGMTAGEAALRICIVNGAEDMNVSAANALLKILEEPPPRSIFLVVSHAPGRLLPTIRSRCRRLAVSSLSDGEVGDVVERLAGKRIPNVAAMNGNPRRALEVATQGEHATAAEFFEAARAANWQVAHSTADRLSPRAAERSFELFLEMVRESIGKTVRAAPQRAASYADAWSWMEESVSEAQAFNLDRKQLVLDLFDRLVEAHRTSTRSARPAA